jgi:hypothetical protein
VTQPKPIAAPKLVPKKIISMALFKPPTDYRSQFRDLSNDELAVITKNQTGQYEARAVQTAQDLLNERYMQQHANQSFRPWSPPGEKKKKFNWTWVVVLYILFQLIRLIVKETNK